jgi:hypothetical protein
LSETGFRNLILCEEYTEEVDERAEEGERVGVGKKKKKKKKKFFLLPQVVSRYLRQLDPQLYLDRLQVQ